MNSLHVLTLVSFLGFATLSAYFFLRNKGHPVNLFFALGMGSLALMEFGSFMAMVHEEVEATFFWERVSLWGECLIPGTWLAFTTSFARKEPWYATKAGKMALFGVGVISAFFAGLMPFSTFVTPGDSSSMLALGRVGKAFYIFFLLGTIAVVANLEHTVRQSAGDQRAKIKYLILGVGGLFVFLIITSSQTLLFSQVDLNTVPVRSSAFVISNGLIAFSLVRHRLMDVNFYMSRFVIYNSLTLLLVGGYLIVVGLVTQMVRSFHLLTGYHLEILSFFLAILILFCLFLSNRIRWKVRMLVNKHFYRSRYDYREEWLKFSEGLSLKLDMEELISPTVAILQDTVGVKEVSLWLSEAPPGELRLAGAPSSGETGQLKTDQRLREILTEKKTPFSLETSWAKSFVADNSEILRRLQPSLFVPMSSGRDVIGLILLGKKTTGEPFLADDIDLLTSAAAQIASAIVNAKLSQELVSVKEMAVFHRFSSFVLHDLKNMVSSLSLLVQNAGPHMSNPQFQKEALETVGRSVNRMEALIGKLSHNAGDLGLNLQETNLNEVVSKVAGRTGQNGRKGETDVQFNLGSIPRVIADREQMEKVVGNLLLNAFEALDDGGLVTIKTEASDDMVVISVSDNGRGISPKFVESELFKPFKSTKKKGLGIGLYQCKTIVEAHRGRIEVQSREREGSTFRVVLPATQKEVDR